MALQNLPKETPEQKTVKGLYDLDSIGRVQSGIMQGYNAVSAFGRGPVGTIQNRIDNILGRIENNALVLVDFDWFSFLFFIFGFFKFNVYVCGISPSSKCQIHVI